MRINPFMTGVERLADVIQVLTSFKENLAKPEYKDVATGLRACMPLDGPIIGEALRPDSTDPFVSFPDLGPIGPNMITGQFDPDHPRRIELNSNIAEKVDLTGSDAGAKWRRLLEAKFVHEFAHYLAKNHPGLVAPPGFEPGHELGIAVEKACYGEHVKIPEESLPPAAPGEGFLEVTESMPRGIRNHNPGNIKKGGDWQGLSELSEMTGFQRNETLFCVFKAPHWGLRAMARLLRNYQVKHNLRTVRGMIGRWAPPSENVTSSYVDAVRLAMGISADAPFEFSDSALGLRMMTAIIRHENGPGQPYSDDQILKGHAAGNAV